MFTFGILSNPVPIEFRFMSCSEYLERARFADSVWTVEDPVLPRGEPAEYARFHRFARPEAQVGLHAGQRVGRQARAFFERDAHFIVPVELVRRGGDEEVRIALEER